MQFRCRPGHSGLTRESPRAITLHCDAVIVEGAGGNQVHAMLHNARSGNYKKATCTLYGMRLPLESGP